MPNPALADDLFREILADLETEYIRARDALREFPGASSTQQAALIASFDASRWRFIEAYRNITLGGIEDRLAEIRNRLAV